MSYLNRTNYKYELKNTGIKKHKKSILTFVFILSLVLLVIVSNTNKSAIKNSISSTFNDFFKQVFVATKTIDSFTAKIGSLTDFINLHSKYKNLEAENEKLKVIINNLSYISEENKALRKLNKFVSSKGTLVLSGNIAVKNPNAYSKEIRILAGSDHNVKEGQIVLDKHGLLGRVTTVGQSTSTILLITDPVSKIPVVFPKIGNKGILSGSHDSNLEISLLEKEKLPAVNDVVITSGDGGFFPPGLIIGNVLSVGSNGEIKIKPLFDINKLNFVSVIEY